MSQIKPNKRSYKKQQPTISSIEEPNPVPEQAPEQVPEQVQEQAPEQVPEQPVQESEAKIPKKRGRKPKGGTIITTIESKTIAIEQKQNIILHLKCNKNELQNNTTTTNEITAFQFKHNKSSDLNYMQLTANSANSANSANGSTSSTSANTNDSEKRNSSEMNETKIILQKLEKLSTQLHLDKIYNKKSNCFYCTCEFDNTPIYIPKFQLNKLFHVYGCFCSPECACAFLMNDINLDTSTRFERYYLLNFIYGKIYNYEKNIKPAPNPFYLLDKYYGTLSIQEYRKLLKSERLLLIVDKPLVRSMPELHNDTDDYLLNNKGVNDSIAKYIPQKQDTIINKNYILNQTFKTSKF